MGFGEVVSRCHVTGEGHAVLPLATGLHNALFELLRVDAEDGRVFLIGNGGSAAVASHIANDFCNTGGLRAATFSETAVLTCFTNDYGYENAYAMLLDREVRPGDLLIAISSSGQSANIVSAVERMRARNGAVITLSGFSALNPLRSLGHLNFWLDSRRYSHVEIGHLLLLHYLADRIGVEKAGVAHAREITHP